MSENSTVRYIAFDDEPATADVILADKLAVKKYLDGFTAFIRDCATPMTTAIQGDWGSGKTSAMNYITQQLEEDAGNIILNFNTWQYSQFNLGDDLAFSLIRSIFERLPQPESNDNNSQKLFRKVHELMSIVGRLTSPLLHYASKKIGVDDAVEAVQETAKEANAIIEEHRAQDPMLSSVYEHDTSPASLLADLRKQLEKYILEITADGQPYHRIYVMVDDLDRLEPERAVEVMEALKTFLNVPNCVFILAIDFNVVLRGVRKKYGADFTEEKARAFFDKIIQIPFNLPVGVYSLSEYVQDYIPQIANRSDEDRNADIRQYVRILQTTVGNNPRSIKRIFNTFNLTRSISRESDDSTERDKETFAMLCFQKKYPTVFDDMVMETRGDQTVTDYLTALESNLSDESDSWQHLSRNDRISLTRMLVEFGKLFGYGNSEKDSYDSNDSGNESAEQRLRQALGNVAVTAIRSASNDSQGENTADIAKEQLKLRVNAHGIEVVEAEGKNSKYKKSLVAGAKITDVQLDGTSVDATSWSALSFYFIKKYAGLIKQRDNQISDGSNNTLTHRNFRYFDDDQKVQEYQEHGIHREDGKPLKQSNIRATEVSVDDTRGYVVANHMGNAINLQGVQNLIAAWAQTHPNSESPVLELTIER